MNIIFHIIYIILNGHFTITADFDNPIEYVISFTVGYAMCEIIDSFLKYIAYKITGMVTTSYDRYETRSATHWFIRSLLLIAIMISAKTGIYQILLIQLTHAIYIALKNFGEKTLAQISDAIFSPYKIE